MYANSFIFIPVNGDVSQTENNSQEIHEFKQISFNYFLISISLIFICKIHSVETEFSNKEATKLNFENSTKNFSRILTSHSSLKLCEINFFSKNRYFELNFLTLLKQYCSILKSAPQSF